MGFVFRFGLLCWFWALGFVFYLCLLFFRVYILGSPSSKLRVYKVELQNYGLGLGFRLWALDFRAWGAVFLVWNLGFRFFRV